jgi:light-regulated signal transduction histidine kinase (bacteriophytochrome)
MTNSNDEVIRCNQRFVDMWNIPRVVADSRDHRQITKAAGERFEDTGAFCDRVAQISAASLPETFDLLELADGRSIERTSRAQFIGQLDVGRIWRFHDITERRQMANAVDQLTAGLEQRVRDRTAELENTNKELEAFSYSVSHDLRAPLRAVDGFAQAAIEDFGPQLPPQCQGYLLSIREGAQRMGTLIDDLLRFSRLGRTPLTKQEIDTGDLVRSVVEDLRNEWSGRDIELRVGHLPACAGDAALLKQVWINLISNAIKFTRRCDSAVIEIGYEATAENKVYFVRDNGTGFDMHYVGKLFGVFQRLHHTEDYEGTGVGLAIVQRIIQRHGGRIWAEGAIDRGATFYFTLQ